MAELYGQKWERSQLSAYAGCLSQLAGVQFVEYTDGFERGVRAAQMRSGSGLNFTVLLDRGMDIGPAEFKGMPLAWLSPQGFPHPSYFEPEGIGWLRTFGGGLVTGCGLTNVGSPKRRCRRSSRPARALISHPGLQSPVRRGLGRGYLPHLGSGAATPDASLWRKHSAHPAGVCPVGR